MAQGETSLVQMESWRWWFLPSWLGLDAPCVVLTWTWAISENSDAILSFRAAAAMILVVWTIYLLDRLIDVARCNDWQKATGRLRFGQRCRPLFLACIGLCSLGIAALLITGIPMEVITRAACVALGLTLHFLVFVVPAVLREKLPGKEFGVGLFFALGAWACLGYREGMLPLLTSVGLLVAFNCLVIAAKDAECDVANDPGGASQWWRTIKRDLKWTGAALTVLFAATAFLTRETTFYISVATAFLGLTVLHVGSQRVSGDAVRALADYALFTPIPIIGVVTTIPRLQP